MTNRLDLLRTFLVAFDALNFREAAVRLSVSPQVVSRAVKSLEDELGELLFHRNTRSVRPSDFAHAFAPLAREALGGLDGLFAVSKPHERGLPQGVVRVAAPSVQGRRLVMPLLMRLAQRYPDLRFDVRLSDEVVDAVTQRIDVGVRVGVLRDSRFVARRVSEVSLPLCASPSLIHRMGEVKSIDELDSLPTTRLIDRNTGRPWPWLFSRNREVLPAQPAFITDDPEAECDAVLAGLGIGQIAGVLANPHLAAGRLRVVLPDAAPKPWPLSVYRVQQQPVPGRIRVTFDALVEGLAKAQG
ncbi:MAG: LysR family transcriptional regulator [Rubrivivax sp.]|nr:MAG: LysR family transcriptional regulator [Rubrivivax sp.]